MNIRDVSTPFVQIDIDLRYSLTARSSKQVRGQTHVYSTLDIIGLLVNTVEAARRKTRNTFCGSYSFIAVLVCAEEGKVVSW